jgi:DnaJ-class molecular chaperone
MTTPAPAPVRCTSCNGTGQGELVITGQGEYRAPCSPCNGTGQQ